VAVIFFVEKLDERRIGSASRRLTARGPYVNATYGCDSEPARTDFKEFWQLFRSPKIEYLGIGGNTVGRYGFPWAARNLDLEKLP
jgi:hypothetical protein